MTWQRWQHLRSTSVRGAEETQQSSWPHASSADFNHTRATAPAPLSRVGAKSKAAAKRGFCPTEISALFLLSNLASTPTFSVKADTVSVVKGGSFWSHEDTNLWSYRSSQGEWINQKVLLSDSSGGTPGPWFWSVGWGFYERLIYVQRWLF